MFLSETTERHSFPNRQDIISKSLWNSLFLYIYKQKYFFNDPILKTTNLYLLILLPFLSLAQELPCKASLKANRGHQFSMSEPKTEACSFIEKDKQVLIRYAPTHNHIVVQYNKTTLWEFKTSGGEIEGPLYIEKNSQGDVVLEDSIDPKARHRKTYMDFFYSSHVVSSKIYYPGKRLASCIYYSRINGWDSLTKAWYTNGIPKTLHVKNLWGSDSVVVQWDSRGVLRSRTTDADLEYYYETGILQEKSSLKEPRSSYLYNEAGILEKTTRDTLIETTVCKQQKTFYPTGILKSVEYYSSSDIPCLTWLLYTPAGILKSKVNKGPILNTENPPKDPWVDAPYEAFSKAESRPEFPGGEGKFKAYMNAALADLLCKSKVPLNGAYTLRYGTDESGKPFFISIDGLQAQETRSLFEAIFSRMPLWKPGRLSGKTIGMQYAVELQVEKIKD